MKQFPRKTPHRIGKCRKEREEHKGSYRSKEAERHRFSLHLFQVSQPVKPLVVFCNSIHATLFSHFFATSHTQNIWVNRPLWQRA